MIAARDRSIGLDLGSSAQSVRTTRERPPSKTQVPAAAKWLGVLGAMPFVFLAVAGPFLEASVQERAHFALVAYGAIILSFLGGIHWGLAIAGALRPAWCQRGSVTRWLECTSYFRPNGPARLGGCFLGIASL